MIVIFEGLDNTGKSTQIDLLKKNLYPDFLFHTVHYSGYRKSKQITRRN